MANQRTFLNWIDDDKLLDAVSFVYQSLKHSMQNTDLKYLQRSTIDPFSLIFETSLAGITIEDWLAAEAQRQAQKRLSNAIGEFHQRVLGSCDGWENLGTGHESGVDLRNADESIYAEIKNKYNTIKGSDKINMLQSLIALANRHKKSTVYMVWILMDKPNRADKTWVVSEVSHPRVILIPGDRFYSLVTGADSVLQELYSALPGAIQRVIQDNGAMDTQDIKAVRELDDLLGTNHDMSHVYSHFFRSAFGD